MKLRTGVMQKFRTYGRAPFTVAVIHGGPGAPGYMAPVARELSSDRGVLEPLQTAASLEGQIQELQEVLERHGDPPITLIGSSWGAMLGYLLSARCPALVRKLILVGSAVFEERYAAGIMETRLGRLSEAERQEVRSLMSALGSPTSGDEAALLARLGRLFIRSDCYAPLTLDTEVLEYQYGVHHSVWREAEELRRCGALLELGRRIRCPVLAIHGDYDPHPPEGIREPLSRVLSDFRFVPLENCGHLPWIERQARYDFYGILRRELV